MTTWKYRSGQRIELGLVQVDIVGHSDLEGTDDALTRAKSIFREQMHGIAAIRGGKRFNWAGDGGAFMFRVQNAEAFELLTLSAIQMLNSLPGVNDELALRTDLHATLSVRISCDSGMAVYERDPSEMGGAFLNAFLKNERAISSKDTVSISERVWKQLHPRLKERFALSRYSDEIGCNLYVYGGNSEQNTRIYRNVHQIGFIEEARRLIEQSEAITFIGTGLNILHQGDLLERIVERSKAGKLRATICFGNPFAPHVQERLVEEERAAVRPEVAAAGIIARVRALLQLTENVPGVEVKLFNNYPTMSIFQFNEEQYVFYPMGYRRLGNQCPVTCVRRPSIYCEFLDEMIRNYLEDAVDADEVFRIRVSRRRTSSFKDPSKVCAVAIYAIPDSMSEFYRQGSLLLGYDVLASRELPAAEPDVDHFAQFVGPARDYGFHCSISDVMYLHENQVAGLLPELRQLATPARPFQLRVAAISEGQFGKNSIVLKCADDSGELERLLAEITVRIRPTALGTNYSLDPLTRNLHEIKSRDRVMLDAYQSPYVLNRFAPHFTLVAPGNALSPDDRAKLNETISRRFESYLDGRDVVQIDRLHVLEKPLGEKYWNPIDDSKIVDFG
jgi:hypothetical protein